jgi:hypothetical protein
VPEPALKFPGVPARKQITKKKTGWRWQKKSGVINVLVVVLVAPAATAVSETVLERALNATAICGDVAGGAKGKRVRLACAMNVKS